MNIGIINDGLAGGKVKYRVSIVLISVWLISLVRYGIFMVFLGGMHENLQK